jgi:hypothetical protein
MYKRDLDIKMLKYNYKYYKYIYNNGGSINHNLKTHISDFLTKKEMGQYNRTDSQNPIPLEYLELRRQLDNLPSNIKLAIDSNNFNDFNKGLAQYFELANRRNISINDGLDSILYYLLNVFPNTHSYPKYNGFIDIRYLFELIYYGARIERNNITNRRGIILYNSFYNDIVTLIEKYSSLSKDYIIQMIIESYPDKQVYKYLRQ